MTPILGKGIADLVSLFVTLWLSVILFAFVDWQELIKCTDEQSCKAKFGDYLIQKVRSIPLLCRYLVETFTQWNTLASSNTAIFTLFLVELHRHPLLHPLYRIWNVLYMVLLANSPGRF